MDFLVSSTPDLAYDNLLRMAFYTVVSFLDQRHLDDYKRTRHNPPFDSFLGWYTQFLSTHIFILSMRNLFSSKRSLWKEHSTSTVKYSVVCQKY